MKVILVTNNNPPYNLRRIHPAWNDILNQGLSCEELLEQVILKNKISGYISSSDQYWIVDDTELPGGEINEENDIFFDAWEWKDKCQVNMSKARLIQMNRIRDKRNKKLKECDIKLEKAIDTGNKTLEDQIRNERQVLRDIPQKFDLTTPNNTTEELMNMWPKELI
jgi:hypothetical protein